MAQGLLAKLGLQPVLANQYDASIAEGAVISQKAGGRHADGALQGRCGNHREPWPNTDIDPAPGDCHTASNGYTSQHTNPYTVSDT